jgi:hypothetical protein
MKWGVKMVGVIFGLVGKVLSAMSGDDPTTVEASLQSDAFPTAVISISSPSARRWQQYLFESVQTGVVDKAKILLEFHKNFANEYGLLPLDCVKDEHGRTLLIHAVLSGSLEMVKLILDSINIFECKDYIERADNNLWNAKIYACIVEGGKEMLDEIVSRQRLSQTHCRIRSTRMYFPSLFHLYGQQKTILEVIPQGEKEYSDGDEKEE